MPNEQTSKVKQITNALPYSKEAEQALLCAILIDNEVQVEVLSTLSEEDFYLEAHKSIYESMSEISRTTTPLDLITLSDSLLQKGDLERVGGIEYLTNIAQIIPSTANYKKYYSIVKRNSTLRKLIRGANKIIENALTSDNEEDALTTAEQIIFNLSKNVDGNEYLTTINEVVPTVLHKFDMVSKDKNALFGIKTHFAKLDSLTNGLQNGDMILIGARPSIGKTSFGMNIVENVALKSGKKCAVFSAEMGRESITQRLICSVAEVSMTDATRGNLKAPEWKRLEIARKMISNADIYICDKPGIPPKEILSISRKLKRKKGLDMILIDYIGLLGNDETKASNTRQNEVAAISKSLKGLARELNVPVIVLSQLSRSVVQDNRRPQLSDLRESGAIEQDADIVMFIHRPDKNKNLTEEEKIKKGIKDNVAEIYLDKQRNGNTGMFKLFFKASCTKFVDYIEEEQTEKEVEVTSKEDIKENMKEIETDIPFENHSEEEVEETKSVDDVLFE